MCMQWAPQNSADVAIVLKMASPGKGLALQSPTRTSIPLLFGLAAEGNAACTVHPLTSEKYMYLASQLMSDLCTAASVAFLLDGGVGGLAAGPWPGETGE